MRDPHTELALTAADAKQAHLALTIDNAYYARGNLRGRLSEQQYGVTSKVYRCTGIGGRYQLNNMQYGNQTTLTELSLYINRAMSASIRKEDV